MNTDSQREPPIDDYSFNRLLHSGKVPLKLLRGAREVDYDIKFHWTFKVKGGRGSFQHRIFFGNYFRNPQLDAVAMTLGSGKPYKTESIIILLDPDPLQHEQLFPVNAYLSQQSKTNPDRRHSIPGELRSKALIELLYKTAKEVGIPLYTPKRDGDTVSISCTLTPLPGKEKGTVDLKTCVVSIDKVEHK